MIAEPIITVMFQRGAFAQAETVATYRALIAFAVGLPAFILVKILAPAFYAHQDTKTPFKIAMVCIVVNLFFNLTLMSTLRHVGMALATSIAGWVNVLLMTFVLVRRKWFIMQPGLPSEVLKIMAASVVMAAALFYMQGVAQGYMASREWIRFLVLGLMVSLGAATYGAANLMLNTMDCRARIKRKFTR